MTHSFLWSRIGEFETFSTYNYEKTRKKKTGNECTHRTFRDSDIRGMSQIQFQN